MRIDTPGNQPQSGSQQAVIRDHGQTKGANGQAGSQFKKGNKLQSSTAGAKRHQPIGKKVETRSHHLAAKAAGAGATQMRFAFARQSRQGRVLAAIGTFLESKKRKQHGRLSKDTA